MKRPDVAMKKWITKELTAAITLISGKGVVLDLQSLQGWVAIRDIRRGRLPSIQLLKYYKYSVEL